MQLLGRRDLRVVFANIPTPTNVISIAGLEHGNFATVMKLANIIWMIFGMPIFCTIIYLITKYSKLHNV